MSLFNIVFLIYASSFAQPKVYVSLAEFFIVFPIFLAAYTGFLADKTKNKAQHMTWASWAQAICYIVMVWGLMSQKNLSAFLLVGLLKFVSDLLSSYKNGLRAPILQANLTKEETPTAFGQLQGLSSLVEILGQPLGVVILSLTGNTFYIVVLVNAVLYFISGSVLYIYRKSLSSNLSTEKVTFQFNLKETLGQIRLVFSGENSQGNFAILLLAIILMNFLLAGIGPLVDLSLLQHPLLGTSYSLSVLVFNLTLSVGMLFGSIFMQDFIKNAKLQNLLLGSFACTVLFSFIMPHLAFLAIFLLFAIAYTAAKVSPRVNALVMENISAENLGKVSGGLSTLFTFSIPFGGGGFVLLSNLIGIEPTLYSVGFIGLAIILGLLGSNRKLIMKKMEQGGS